MFLTEDKLTNLEFVIKEKDIQSEVTKLLHKNKIEHCWKYSHLVTVLKNNKKVVKLLRDKESI